MINAIAIVKFNNEQVRFGRYHIHLRNVLNKELEIKTVKLLKAVNAKYANVYIKGKFIKRIYYADHNN